MADIDSPRGRARGAREERAMVEAEVTAEQVFRAADAEARRAARSAAMAEGEAERGRAKRAEAAWLATIGIGTSGRP